MKVFLISICLLFLTFGCSKIQRYSEPTWKSARREAEAAKFGNKVNRLNLAGTGSVQACELKYSGSTISVSYHNDNGKRLSIHVYDEYIIDTVLSRMDAKETVDFKNFIEQATNRARDNSDLEDLNLGTFKQLEMKSEYGKVRGYWRGSGGGLVSTPIDAARLIHCIKMVQPHL
jgi:hypothetical protein